MTPTPREPRKTGSPLPSPRLAPPWLIWGAVAGLLIIFAAQNIVEMRQESATADEAVHLSAGFTYLLKRDFRLNPEHPPLLKLLCAAPLLALHPRVNFDDPAWTSPRKEYAFGSRFLYVNDADRLLFWGRIPIVLLGLLLGAVVFRWSQQLYGNIPGFFALGFYVFCPNIIAHSHLITSDLGVSAFLTLSLYFLWRYSERGKNLSLVWGSLAMGAALASKFSALIFFPLAVALAWCFYRPGVASSSTDGSQRAGAEGKKPDTLSGRNSKRKPTGFSASGNFWKALLQADRGKVVAVVAFVVLAWVVVDLSYLGSFSPKLYLRGVSLVNENHLPDFPFYLHGELKAGGWWYYFIVTFLVKTTVPLLLVILAGLAHFLKNFQKEWKRAAFLLLPGFACFAAVSALADPLGVRYLLPIFPLFIIFSSRLVKYFSDYRAVSWALVALLAWHITTSLAAFPNSLSYFNEFVGGPSHGTQWLDDSNVDWGQGMKRLKKTLDEHSIDSVILLPFSLYSNPNYYGIRCTRPPRQEWEEIFSHPQPGIYAVSANWVARAKGLGYDWKKQYPILAHVGYSMFIFEVR
jgi:4-amino-4-deoxy-L-arabinose transferase-like glycosyltransferase